MTDGSVVGVDPRRPMVRVAVLGTGEVDVVLIGENCVTSWRGGVVDKGVYERRLRRGKAQERR